MGGDRINDWRSSVTDERGNNLNFHIETTVSPAGEVVGRKFYKAELKCLHENSGRNLNESEFDLLDKAIKDAISSISEKHETLRVEETLSEDGREPIALNYDNNIPAGSSPLDQLCFPKTASGKRGRAL